MKSSYKTKFRTKRNLSYIDSVPCHDSIDLNQSEILPESSRLQRSSLQKSKSTLILRMKEQIQLSCGDQGVHKKNPSMKHLLSFQDSKLIFNKTIDNVDESLEDSLEPTPRLFGCEPSDKEGNSGEEILKPLNENDEEKAKSNTLLSLHSQQTLTINLDSKPLETEEKDIKKPKQDVENKLPTSPKKEDIEPKEKTPSRKQEYMRDMLSRNFDENNDKSLIEHNEKELNPENKKVPVFVFHIPKNTHGLKSTNTQGNGSLKDRIKERILDLVDTNTFKITSPMQDYEKRALEDRNGNKGANVAVSPLLRVGPVSSALANKAKKPRVYEKQLDETKSSLDNMAETCDFTASTTQNASYLSSVQDKVTKRQSSLKRQQSLSSMKKTRGPGSLTSNPTLTTQRTIDYSIEDTCSGQRSKNSEFSFKMTYFKPIDESKLDEFIQGTNMSKTQKTPVVLNTPTSVSPIKKQVDSKVKKPSESVLNRSQDVMNASRDYSATRQKKETKKVEEYTPKKVDIRSVSSQRNKAISIVPMKVTQRPSSALRQNTTSKLEIDHFKERVKVTMETQPDQDDKKSLTSRTSRRSEIPAQINLPKGRESLGHTRGGNTYFKLDKLLQELKSNKNNSKILKEDDEVSNAPSEAGLFNQNANQGNQISAQNNVNNAAFRKALLVTKEGNR